jgi:hypothetical protein
MIDERILNGAPRCTLIESFKGSVIVIAPDCQRTEYPTVEAANQVIKDNGWVISVDHIHGKVAA